jgi:hypothetical protein
MASRVRLLGGVRAQGARAEQRGRGEGGQGERRPTCVWGAAEPQHRRKASTAHCGRRRPGVGRGRGRGGGARPAPPPSCTPGKSAHARNPRPCPATPALPRRPLALPAGRPRGAPP